MAVPSGLIPNLAAGRAPLPPLKRKSGDSTKASGAVRKKVKEGATAASAQGGQEEGGEEEREDEAEEEEEGNEGEEQSEDTELRGGDPHTYAEVQGVGEGGGAAVVGGARQGDAVDNDSAGIGKRVGPARVCCKQEEEDGRASSSAVAEVCAVLAGAVGEEEAHALLGAARGDVGAAINFYYDGRLPRLMRRRRPAPAATEVECIKLEKEEEEEEEEEEEPGRRGGRCADGHACAVGFLVCIE